MTLLPADDISAGVPEPTGVALSGYVEGVLHGRVVGWCCDRAEPASRLTVEVYVDDLLIGTGTADLQRESVARAGFADGRYGFEIALPSALADGGVHQVRVRAGGLALPPTPGFIPGARRGEAEGPWLTTTFRPVSDAEPAITADEPAARRHAKPTVGSSQPQPVRLLGYVDGVVAGRIAGWLADPSAPEESIPVEAFLDGVMIGVSSADERRPDVARQGFGERHGFRIELPEPLVPGTYVLEVRTAAEGRRVPLASDYRVLDFDQRPMPGVELKEPRPGAPTDPAKPISALLGLGGWLFEWPSARVFNIIRGADPMPRAVFERQLARILERREMARATGVILIEAAVPAKLAVYAEQLPAGLEVDDRQRPAEQLAAALRDENGVELLDLTAPLRQARHHGTVFAATGAGLTWLGGFHAYRCIAKELAKSRPGLEPLAPAALELDELEPLPDGLAGLPRLVWIGADTVAAGIAADDEEREGRPRLDWRHVAADYAVLEPELAGHAGASASLLRRREPDRGADAVVIHDGAAATLVPFLAEHFDDTLIVGGDADLDALVQSMRPAVVLEVVAEASLLR
jgi:hypothetical protein